MTNKTCEALSQLLSRVDDKLIDNCFSTPIDDGPAWIAQDFNGIWYFYRRLPKCVGHAWFCGDRGMITSLGSTQPLPNWDIFIIEVGHG